MMDKRLYFITSSGLRIPVETADRFLNRFLGLMGRKEGAGGLLLSPCNSVHTCFMRFTLDVLFLDDTFRIIAIRKGMRPFRATRVMRGAKYALEFPASLKAIENLSEGMVISLSQSTGSCL